MGNWEPQNIHQNQEINSNFLNLGIEREKLANAPFTDVEIEFTDRLYSNPNGYFIYDVMIYVQEKLSQKTHWEIYLKVEYFDFKIILGEVYHDALFTIEKLNDNELILIEKMEANESDTYFQRISLERMQSQSQVPHHSESKVPHHSESKVPHKSFWDFFKSK